MVQESYSYNGGLIVYRTTPFSMALNDPDFKVRPFLTLSISEMVKRYGHSYYGRRIGNRTQAFKWYQFQ